MKNRKETIEEILEWIVPLHDKAHQRLESMTYTGGDPGTFAFEQGREFTYDVVKKHLKSLQEKEKKYMVRTSLELEDGSTEVIDSCPTTKGVCMGMLRDTFSGGATYEFGQPVVSIAHTIVETDDEP